jgi:hypothetical protein
MLLYGLRVQIHQALHGLTLSARPYKKEKSPKSHKTPKKYYYLKKEKKTELLELKL